MSAYPFASDTLVAETLGVIGAPYVGTTQQTLLRQVLVACGSGGAVPSTPSTPTGFTATPGNQFTTLNWNAQSEADTFTINYGLTNDFGASTELTASATGAQFVHSSGESIVVGNRYYYWIQAVNLIGESSFTTSEVSARSYVTLGNTENATLQVPSPGAINLNDLLFRTGGAVPAGVNLVWGVDLFNSSGVGTWEDVINGGFVNPVISGVFLVENFTGAALTFWDTEP